MRRPLLINGFMGTGKSAVGRALAARTARPFVDLDALTVEGTGLTVAELFAKHGEPEFRARERRALASVLARGDTAPPVVALGGGALVQRETRLDALDRAVVVTLEASADEIARRLSGDDTRPLLSGPDPRSSIETLLAQRALAYAEAHARISTDQKSPEAVAAELVPIWQTDALAVAAGESSYSVEIGSGILAERLQSATGKPSRLILVSDRTVQALYGARVATLLGEPKPVLVELSPGEENKHIGSVEQIWRAALEASADRRSCFVALGGGVVTDITGFAAATYMRGVSWVGVPTTLLAMVDASVGGKTGVDLLAAKNAVGAFWQPRRVLCDVDLLASESPRAFQSALAEVLKTALIGDAELFDLLERDAEQVAKRPTELLIELVRRSIRVKARIVGLDQRESGLRAVLNLGHTVGHAVEAVAGYSRLTHGEAVSLGLVAALRIGVTLGLTPSALAQRVEGLLARLGLPTAIEGEPLEDAARLIGHDKKRAGAKLRFVVAKAAGEVDTVDLGLEQLQTLTRGLARSA